MKPELAFQKSVAEHIRSVLDSSDGLGGSWSVNLSRADKHLITNGGGWSGYVGVDASGTTTADVWVKIGPSAASKRIAETLAKIDGMSPSDRKSYPTFRYTQPAVGGQTPNVEEFNF